MDVNEHEQSTHIHGDRRLQLSVQQYEAGREDACLLIRANRGALSCGIDLSAAEALAFAAALTRHAHALRIADTNAALTNAYAEGRKDEREALTQEAA
jgi:hypothetical protein